MITITHLYDDNAILDVYDDYHQLSEPNIHMEILNILPDSNDYYRSHIWCRTPVTQMRCAI